MKKILIIVGTRPEAIKLAVFIKKLEENYYLKPFIVKTGQHTDMVEQIFSLFNIKNYIDLNIMNENQTLMSLKESLEKKLSEVLLKDHYDSIVVQGDTMSAFVGANLGFLNKIPVFHIEAGLRSFDLHNPFPEEGIRKTITIMSKHHFTPTPISYKNLRKEGVNKKDITIVGNTVIDTMFYTINNFHSNFHIDKPFVIITVHRRENHGENLKDILKAIQILANQNKNLIFLFPIHPNPVVKNTVKKYLKGFNNIILSDPLGYVEMVFALKNTLLVISDSGGLQEEAVSLGKNILILRETTERPEVLKETGKLIGTKTKDIIYYFYKYIKKPSQKKIKYIFGKGCSSEKIIHKIEEILIPSKNDF